MRAMLAVDLRVVLSLLVLLLVAAAGAAVWMDRRLRGGPGADALDVAPFGVLLLREGDGRLAYANPAARRQLGLVGEAVRLPEASWADELAAARARARADGAALVGVRGDGLPGGRAVRWWVAPREGGDLVFVEDVSAERRAAESARFLLSDLSHELRTPLATILTHLAVLGPDVVDDEVGRRSVGMLRAEAERMSRLVGRLLELGRLETGAELERVPVDLVTLAEEAIEGARPAAAERGIRLALEAEPGLPTVRGDADRLRQVLVNLLDNAVKHGTDGETVTVALEAGADGLACAVMDTGPGIPAEHLPYVTRRFYRAAPRADGGSGLGLALAAEIVRRHGAELVLDSRTEGPDRGTTARFVLPTDGSGG
jgi:signal transduction histidine kinase